MEKGIVYIGDNVFESLLAISMEEQRQGLMNIAEPVPNMAFVYGYPSINHFWMANTPSQLDIIFCNDGMVSEICYGEPYSTKMIGGDMPSNLVVELPYGTVKTAGIIVGQSVGLVKPTIDELRKIIASKYWV